MSLKRIPGNARMSNAVITGSMVYLKGVIPAALDASVAAQTQDVLDQIDALLAEAGSGRAKVVQVMIWLRDMADFDAMNAVYDGWVVAGSEPVRACVEARLAQPKVRVEIQVTALA